MCSVFIGGTTFLPRCQSIHSTPCARGGGGEARGLVLKVEQEQKKKKNAHTHFRRVSTDGRGSEVRQNLDERFPACEPHVVPPQNGFTSQSKSITY